MRIAELTAFHARIPLKKTIRHASHTRDANDTLLVRCRLAGGAVGWGEGLPRPYVTGETIDSAFEHLRDGDLPRQLGGEIGGLADAIDRTRSLQLPAPPNAKRDCFGNSVRCAIELAVLDAVAREEGRPLSAVAQLIPETAAIREASERVRYSAAITPRGAFQEIKGALKLRYYGFEQIKIKVGVDGISDSSAVRRIRWAAGSAVDLRVDANEAWSCETLSARVQPLRRFNITAVEQPVPHAQADGLAAVRASLGIPIMLDESLCSATDAERAIERGTCDLFNIRLSKCGGIVPSMRLAAMAHRAGLGYQLGCQVGETGILSAAGRHFASSIGGIRYLEGSYDRLLVAERLTVQDLTFKRGGYAPALTGPGLGIDIDTDAVRRVAVKEEHWSLA